MQMEFDFSGLDKRQAVIDKMNSGRASRGQSPLTPRQEHLVREFMDDEGNILEQDVLMNLLKSNSA